MRLKKGAMRKGTSLPTPPKQIEKNTKPNPKQTKKTQNKSQNYQVEKRWSCKYKYPFSLSSFTPFFLLEFFSFLFAFLLLPFPLFPPLLTIFLFPTTFPPLPSPFFLFIFLPFSFLCCRSAVSPSNTDDCCPKCSWEPYQLVLLQLLITMEWHRLYLPERLPPFPGQAAV